MALRPSGFVEYSPSEQLKFDQLVEIIKRNYERFGYTHIHTPAVEANTVLLSKNGEETGKQIFGLYGLAQGAEDLKDYSLHFDLTVPFARYVLDRESELTLPFKRYQIQPVRRGERAQKGRFREFFQCDLDVIWRKDSGKSYLFYDAEVIFNSLLTLQDILEQMEIDDTVVMHISNRKLLAGFLLSVVSQDQLPSVSSLIDKFHKIGLEGFLLSLQDLELSIDQAKKIADFVGHKVDLDSLDAILNRSESALFQQGVLELKEVLTTLKHLEQGFGKKVSYQVDFQIVRGLDYYTGTVFEATLEGDKKLGSIYGGGSYENLTGYLDPKRDFYAGVGGSIGITRLLSKIFEEKSFSQNTVVEYLLVNFPETVEDIYAVAGRLVADGKHIELYPTVDKLGKQFAYADKKGIPYVVVLGQGEKDQGIYKIKDMKTGEEGIHTL
ncbi:MAG: histidine--tRNA ligase [Candidatus Absconditabacteria bacterium]|nr:histidine--tRNA ligase [Candidatus Absconditabacteria bacterium]MDD3868347.1 histidine--tRNA ligase [Candidatus Absconditabacteria bacterium]MDD4714422.1 histidine--tRNA ligase [Candidatus Absconditabacteria bacterium]